MIVEEQSALIDHIESFPHLWDKKNAMYSDIIAKENAWKTISTIMEKTVKECKDSWDFLRSKYIRERRVIKNIPSGTRGNIKISGESQSQQISPKIRKAPFYNFSNTSGMFEVEEEDDDCTQIQLEELEVILETPLDEGDISQDLTQDSPSLLSGPAAKTSKIPEKVILT
ncbi:unnamed protein product [Ceutorhynchus assimilis]|uniref:MADF domain-containing protein n=1 Tax=Ceutorhynchus assimilis TaxID=467358 RepID=A0A9N9MDP9_9CUCU|nr:unnamed protein product [Ceutorhynchus assimilis]